MAVSQEMIIKVMADVKQAVAGLKQLQSAMTGTSKAAKLAATPLMSKQLKDIDKLYGAWGDSAGAAKEKLSLLKGEMRKMVAAGDTGNKRFGIYGNMIKNLSGNAGNAAFSFKNMGTSLAKAGESLANNVPYMGQALQLLKQFPPEIALIIAAVVALGIILKQGVGFNAMLENEQMAFQVMLKDIGKAQDLMGDLKSLSLTTPIGVAEGAAGAKQLLAYGFAQKDIIENLKMMSTVAKAVNVPLSDMVYVYGTLRAQGRAYTRDLTQFAMRGIPIYENLAAVMGVPVKELKKMGEEGQITFVEVEKAMKRMTGEGGQFAGMLEAQMKTVNGLQTVIKNTWDQLTGAMTEAFMPILKVVLKDIVFFLRSLGGFAEVLNVIFLAVGAAIWVIWEATKIVLNSWLIMYNLIGYVIKLVKILVSLIKNLVDSMASSFGNKLPKWANDFVKAMWEWQGPINWLNGQMARLSRYLDEINAKVSKKTAKDSTTTIDSYAKNKAYLLAQQQKDIMTPAYLRAGQASGNARQMAEVIKGVRASLKSRGYKFTPEEVRNILFGGDVVPTALYEELNAALAEDAKKKYPNAAAVFESVINGGAAVESALASAVNTFQGGYDWAGKFGENLTFGFKRLASDLKASGYSKEVVDALVDPMKSDALSQVDEAIKAFDILFVDEQFADQKKGILAYLKTLREELAKGKGTAKEIDSILAAYAEFRKENMTNESIFSKSGNKQLRDFLRTTQNLVGQTDIYQRQITDIVAKYTKMGEEEAKRQDKPLTPEQQAWLAAMQKGEIDIVLVTRGNSFMDAATRMGTQMANAASVGFQSGYDSMAKGVNTLWDGAESFGLGMQQAAQMLSDAYTQIEFAFRDDIGSGIEAIFTNLTNGLQPMFKFFSGMLDMAGTAIAKTFSNTEMGKITKALANLVQADTPEAQGIAAADLWSLLLQIAMSALSELESFQEVFNGITKMLTDAFSALDPVFESLALVLPYIGRILSAVLVPIIETVLPMLQDLLLPIIALLDLLRPYLAAAVKLFAIWAQYLNPATAGLRMLWYIFKAIAKIFGLAWDTYDDMASSTDAAKESLDRQLKTLQELYNVGAISGAEYEARLKELQGSASTTTDIFAGTPFEGIFSDLQEAFDILVEAVASLLVPLLQLLVPYLKTWLPVIATVLDVVAAVMTTVANVLTAVVSSISAILTLDFASLGNIWSSFADGTAAVWTNFASQIGAMWGTWWNAFKAPFNALIANMNKWFGWSIPSFAVGAGNLSNDTLAQVHAGEMIIPSSFADSIRNGDLALSGSGMGGSGNTVVVNVEGSVVTERELIDIVADGVSQSNKRGYRK